MAQNGTRPYLLRTITNVSANETNAPSFTVLDGVAQWNQNQVSPVPGFNLYPYVRMRIDGTGTSGDVIELRGKLNDGTLLTLGTAVANASGRFPAFVDCAERQDCSYGVRVPTRTGTLTGVKVFVESYQSEQARVLVS